MQCIIIAMSGLWLPSQLHSVTNFCQCWIIFLSDRSSHMQMTCPGLLHTWKRVKPMTLQSTGPTLQTLHYITTTDPVGINW